MNSAALFQSALLIEDDPGHEMIIRRALTGHVAEIQSVSTFNAAKLALKSKKLPQIIISDLNLPDSASAQHVKVMRELFPQVPLMVLTSSTSLHDAVEAMKFGARDFLVKNFDKDFKDIIGLSLARLATALELERERSKLQTEMQVLRAAIENGQDALAVTDAAGKVLYANRSFLEFAKRCGGLSENILEMFSAQVYRNELLKDNIAKHIKELSSGGVWQTEITFVANKETAFSLSLSVYQTDGVNEDRMQKCVCWVRDTSENKRRERFQREILSTTTHDLKGPLGAISISAELVQDMLEKKSKASELVLRIASSAQGALNLIDEFLSARRIQEGTFILKPQEHDLSAVVGEAASEYLTIAEARSIELAIKKSEAPVPSSFDKIGISRVVGNLLSNAIKFTPKGGKVGVRCWEEGGQQHIAIQDSGSGMEPAEVQKLFERFSRLDRHSEVAGSGIGLFVVKSIVTAHGGKIEVTSQPGQGSTFEVIIPRYPPVNERGELISLDFA